MKKHEQPQKEQQPQNRAPKQPKGVTELTNQELEQVQGGCNGGHFGKDIIIQGS